MGYDFCVNIVWGMIVLCKYCMGYDFCVNIVWYEFCVNMMGYDFCVNIVWGMIFV